MRLDMINGKQKILIVDDHQMVLESYKELLREEPYNIDYFQSGSEAYRHFKKCPNDYLIAFIDYNLAQDDGVFSNGCELIRCLKKINEDIIVVIASADESEEAYREWIEADANKFLYKPITKPKILANIKAAFSKNLQENIPELRREASKDYAHEIKMIGISFEFQDLAKNTLRYAEVDSEVLILGETGTGKELVARALHNNSKRSKSGQFIAINCSSFKGDSHLMESELFGHEKGAFTGAVSQKTGIFEAAHGGTVFLDEIHHLSKEAQAKLLRAIQEKKIKRVGSTKEFSVDFRLVCAGKPKLKEMCKGNDPEFFPDLYYRISTLDLEITPLRERIEDVLPLLIHFKKIADKKFNVEKEFSSSSIRALKSYSWPGNIRELENLVERLYVQVDDRIIRKKHLPDDILQISSIGEAVAGLDLESLERLQREQVKKVILAALKNKDHNIKQAAIDLNVKRTTLNSRMKSLEIFDSSPAERNGMLNKIIENFSSFRLQ
jgi:DNA-binding NtrC family response regulator